MSRNNIRRWAGDRLVRSLMVNGMDSLIGTDVVEEDVMGGERESWRYSLWSIPMR